tara:strand:+ start:1107 stop:1283 length:177 start_codon:yes stop_codon:yes gene_type:complete
MWGIQDEIQSLDAPLSIEALSLNDRFESTLAPCDLRSQGEKYGPSLTVDKLLASANVV